MEGRGCHGTTSCSLWRLAFRAHPTAQTAARRPRPCQAPPTRGAIPRPRAWGSPGLCELLFSTGQAVHLARLGVLEPAAPELTCRGLEAQGR